jgi:hypothetical protein
MEKLAVNYYGRLGSPCVSAIAAESFARRVVPDYPEVPAALPADWLPAVG